MSAPSTGDEFLDLVRKSGVVDEKRLSSYLEKDGKSPLPGRPGKLAGLLVRDRILTRFQAEQFLQGKWRRFTIGKYKVLDRIGIGGMGSVYLCEHKFMRRLAAVKVLPTTRARDPSSLERFYREGRAVAALDHPNIVRAYDIDQEDGLHFLVMEYVDGSSLQEIVRREGPLDPGRSARYIYQAALGLQHAHEVASLVHRDIKPGNLIVDRAGTVKILDMGLARFFNDEADLLTKKYDDNVLGTADYLAPEQVLDSHGVDIRADIYSLGATFYFCLTGRTTFGEGTVAQKLIWHQTRRPKPIKNYRSDVPEDMNAVLDKMLAKDVGLRYQTPLDVAKALMPWVENSQATDAPAGQDSVRLQAEKTIAARSAFQSAQSVEAPAAKTSRTWDLAASGTAAAADKGGLSNRSADSVNAAVSDRGESRSDVQSATAEPPEIFVPASASTGSGEEGDSLPWESLMEDTPDPRLKADTAPHTPLRIPPVRPADSQRLRTKGKSTAPLESRGPLSYWVLGGTGAVVTALVILLLSWLLSSSRPNRGDAANGAGPNDLYVRNTDPKGAFRELTSQIARALPHQHIIVDSPVVEGPLEVIGRKSISIQAEKGKRVVFQLPVGSREKRIAYFHDVEDVEFQGFVLDGQDQVDHVIELAMNCPGLTLHHLALQGFQRCGIVVANCAGSSDRPVSLTDIKFLATAEREAGLVFEINPRITVPVANDHIHVSHCEFGNLKARHKLLQPSANGLDVIVP
jgi:eukaryotic-like serine/threonine-protein kinase